MKKIIHLIDSLAIGGAQTHLLTILKCPSPKRYFYVVCSLTTNELDITSEIESLGIKVICLSLQEHLKKKRWASVIRAIYRMLKDERPDILVTHLIWSRILGTIASIIIGRKRIISYEQGDVYSINWKYRIASFLLSFFIDVIITVSKAMKKWIFKNYWIPYDKVLVMYNPVSTDFFKPEGDRENFRKRLKIGQDEIVMGSIGTLGKGINKGMNYCIDAMAVLVRKYKNIKLVIVGDGELRGTLEEQAKDLGLENVVKFLGWRKDIDSILKAIDIFVLASIFEPCGIAILEAMAMEKVVVGSASGGTSELIEEGVNGFLFRPGDSKHLAGTIEKLIRDERLRKEMGIKGRKSVEEKFEAKKYVKRLESIYAGLLQEA